jgi:hypothetical protein
MDKGAAMRGITYNAEFYRGEISKLKLWLLDQGITQEQRAQWNKELESAREHLAELEGK